MFVEVVVVVWTGDDNSISTPCACEGEIGVEG